MPTTWNTIEKPGLGYLLKEDAFYLLLETGDKIVLSYGTEYTNDSKP